MSATFDRKVDASQWASKTEAEIRNGKHFPKQAAKRTLNEAIHRYLKEVLPHKRPNTIAQQSQQLNWWKAEMGRHALAAISAPLIIEARGKLAAQGLAPATQGRYVAALSHVFTLCVQDWGWLDDSPMTKLKRQKESRGRCRYLDKLTELPALRKACREHPHPDLLDVVEIALGSGMRKNEILTLRWTDVDLDRAMIYLRDTKNGEARNVALAGHALEVLAARKAARNRIDTDLVFPRPGEAKPIDIDRQFRQALDTAKIENFCFHDLRHTFASFLAMSGATLPEIAGALGHKTYSMVQRYAHLSDNHTSRVIDRMAGLFLSQGEKIR
jgi:integrase